MRGLSANQLFAFFVFCFQSFTVKTLLSAPSSHPDMATSGSKNTMMTAIEKVLHKPETKVTVALSTVCYTFCGKSQWPSGSLWTNQHSHTCLMFSLETETRSSFFLWNNVLNLRQQLNLWWVTEETQRETPLNIRVTTSFHWGGGSLSELWNQKWTVLSVTFGFT